MKIGTHLAGWCVVVCIPMWSSGGQEASSRSPHRRTQSSLPLPSSEGKVFAQVMSPMMSQGAKGGSLRLVRISWYHSGHVRGSWYHLAHVRGESD